MFAMRGIAVSFSVFVIVYCGISIAVLCIWRRLQGWIQSQPVQRIADVLFAVRIFPLLLAILITAAFAIPSFVLLEPRAIVEPVGDVPLTLALFGSALAVLGFANAALAMAHASRTVSRWGDSALRVPSTAPFPVLRIQSSVPAMTAAGILRPRILLSGSAEFLLNGNELRSALNHEIAHIRRRDNLKKLLLRFVTFPAMHALETAWLQASEMAADDAAVSSTAEALDLAAALIKLSKMKASEPPPELTAALVHGHIAVINARIERLISWSDEDRVSQDFPVREILALAVSSLAVLVACYGSLLTDLHRATEWLIR